MWSKLEWKKKKQWMGRNLTKSGKSSPLIKIFFFDKSLIKINHQQNNTSNK